MKSYSCVSRLINIATYSETSLFWASEHQPPRYYSQMFRLIHPLIHSLKSSHLTNPATFVCPKGGWNSEVPLYFYILLCMPHEHQENNFGLIKNKIFENKNEQAICTQMIDITIVD